ncbi:helix-turn-helix transcriptional regulator [Streptomyces sp. NPDC005953]|uniref:helix-turn-helix domain-containing protein n=1 Tax=Streptomyces sp. NPDC005953 TaxID=3156719 RepID=UPI0033FDBCC3
MAPARLHLTDPELLRKLMLWAPQGKVTGQELARAAGISKQKVSAMLHGERVTVEREVARRIAATLGVHQGALFFQPLPTPMGVGSVRKETDGYPQRDEHQRAIDADASGIAQELGEHPRQGEPYRQRPPR